MWFNKIVKFVVLCFILMLILFILPEDKNYEYGKYTLEPKEPRDWPIGYLLYDDTGSGTSKYMPIYINDYYEDKGYLYFSYLDATGVGYETCFHSKKIHYGKLNISSGNLYFDIPHDEIAKLDYKFTLQNKTKRWLEIDNNRCRL